MQKERLEEEKEFSFKNWILHYRSILFVLFIYFSLHFINLTLLPPFNDESIYIDWAWSYTHMPGHLYDSLLDAKQPLMIWIFAFFQNFFSDPLFAGRFVSVLFGAGTVIGIYFVAKRLFDNKIAFLSALLFSVIPIFVFYNRQALMEASIACVGIWAFYALLRLIHEPTRKYAIWLGVILGIGFFIKSSSLLFIVAASVIFFYFIIKKGKTQLIKSYFISSVSFFCVTFFLFINPIFWQTFSTNSRYSFTLAEVLQFPFNTWMSHLFGFFEIGLFFITPLVFLCGFIGMILMKKNKIRYSQIFIIYFICALTIEIFSAKFQGQRYLVPFLPFFVISASYILSNFWRDNVWKKSVVIISFLIPFILSVIVILDPEQYILQMSKLSKYSEIGYIRGQTSGYSIKETMQYIKEHSVPSQPTLVLFALNSGNPESAIDVYSNQDPDLYALRIDARFFPGIEQYQCLTSKYPLFFVTRNDQRSGMDRYFDLAKSFPNPDGNYSIGIYTLKDCKGNTASLSDFYQGAMNKIYQMRSIKTY